MTFFDEQPDGDPHGECALEIARLEQERDVLAAQNETLREALEDCQTFIEKRHGYMNALNLQARKAITLPNTAADVLRQRDARVLREAANEITYGGTVDASEQLRAMADELERKNG